MAYILIDSLLNKVIAQGDIINQKNVFATEKNEFKKCNAISFDNIHFIVIKNHHKLLQTDIETFILDIPDSYIIKNWTDVCENDCADVYIEKNINDLDEEVIDLVNSLNQLKNIRTTGSCSGHMRDVLWVDISFETLKSLNIFCNKLLLFSDKFILHTAPNVICNDKEGVLLRLSSKQIGKPAYSAAITFAKFLALKKENFMS